MTHAHICFTKCVSTNGMCQVKKKIKVVLNRMAEDRTVHRSEMTQFHPECVQHKFLWCEVTAFPHQPMTWLVEHRLIVARQWFCVLVGWMSRMIIFQMPRRLSGQLRFASASTNQHNNLIIQNLCHKTSSNISTYDPTHLTDINWTPSPFMRKFAWTVVMSVVFQTTPICWLWACKQIDAKDFARLPSRFELQSIFSVFRRLSIILKDSHLLKENHLRNQVWWNRQIADMFLWDQRIGLLMRDFWGISVFMRRVAWAESANSIC